MQSIRRSGKHRPRQIQVPSASIEALETRRLLSGPPVTNIYANESGVLEGGTGYFRINAFADQMNQPAISVRYVVTPTAGGDHGLASGSVTIGPWIYPGRQEVNIAMPTLPDNLVESAELVTVTLLPDDQGRYSIGIYGCPPEYLPPGVGTAAMTIVDSPPAVNIYPVNDGQEGGSPMRLHLTRGGGDVTTPVAVTLELGSGSTASAADIQLPPISILTDAYIDIAATDDTDAEWSENAVLQVVATSTSSLGTTWWAQAEIVDNDWSITGLPENLVVSSEDLYPISIASPSSGPSDAVISVYCPPSVILWEDSDRSSSPLTNGNGSYYWFGTAPATLWLEAILPSTVVGDIVLQVSGTNPATSQQSPANPATSQPATAWKLNGITVVSGATQDGVDVAVHEKTWIAVRQQGDKVVLEADVAGPADTPVPDGLLDWMAGDSVPEDTARRTVSRDTPANTLVTVRMGMTVEHADIWVIWATIVFRVSGDAPSAVGRFPDVNQTGVQQLGWYEYMPSSGLAGIGGRVALVATLLPQGVEQVLSQTSLEGGRLKIDSISVQRTRETQLFIDGQLNTNPQLEIGTTSGQVDDMPYDTFQNVEGNLVYDRDFPTMQAYYGGATHSAEIYHKFRQWVTFNGTPISDDAYWKFSVVWLVDLPYDEEVTPPFPEVYRVLGSCSEDYILPQSAQVL